MKHLNIFNAPYLIDSHISLIILIMVISGGFGGYLNYLHNFDISAKDLNSKNKRKYILLGIGAAFLVPAFLKMISSDLVENSREKNSEYLIFAGFCLVASIFSRRFITTLGEKILEAAEKAERVALESKEKIESTQIELTSTRERIEDVKLAVDIKNTERVAFDSLDDNKEKQNLIGLANSYIEKTSVPNYTERIKLKAELGRKMGEIIIRNNIPKEELLFENTSEGMLVAIAYSIQLRPDENALKTLNQIAGMARQLHTKYTILVGYDTLARNSFISRQEASKVFEIVEEFKFKADGPLLRKINDTISILNLINS